MDNNFLDDGHSSKYGYSSRPYGSKKSPKRSGKRIALIVIADILLIGVGLCIFALFHHVIKKELVPDSQYSAYTTPTQTAVTEIPDADVSETGTAAIDTADVDVGTWGAKFADKFTDGDVVRTADSYMSKDINISIERVQEISNQYSLTYYVADIYVRDIENFLTAFAQDTYGKGIAEMPPDMAVANDAIIAISGDYYGNTLDGVVIRNGQPYRGGNMEEDVLIMYSDGSMETFSPSEFDMDAILEKGAYQGWSFGPMLLDNGAAMQKGTFNCTVNPRNPRCAIGYYELGHYCFVMVDGRQSGYSDGMSTEEMSKLFEELDCAVAYNMDGGQSAYMVFMGEVVNQPYNGGRPISDIVYIAEVE